MKDYVKITNGVIERQIMQLNKASKHYHYTVEYIEDQKYPYTLRATEKSTNRIMQVCIFPNDKEVYQYLHGMLEVISNIEKYS